jgi:hypothetical protein
MLCPTALAARGRIGAAVAARIARETGDQTAGLGAQTGATAVMPDGPDSILSYLTQEAKEREAELPPEAFTIVGFWNTEYAVRLRPASTPLHLKHVCVETNAIGTCYYERDLSQQPTIEENLIGRRIERAFLNRIWRIAAYDALYANIIRKPDSEIALNGSPMELAKQRATIVCDEVRRLAHQVLPKSPQLKVVNVGVVGDFLEQLSRDTTFSLQATDFYDTIVDETYHGVKVLDGRRYTVPLVRDADIALVTGMTLANGTMEGIFEAARKGKTALVFFAETGANFAEEYLKLGADTVISEPFPFYLSGSPKVTIRVYRRQAEQ